MCQQTQCPRCKRPTWAGCGRHVEDALASVPKEKRCSCPPEASFLRRLFGNKEQ